MYTLCHLASDGQDPSVFNTLVRRRLILKRGEYLYRNGDSFHEIYAVRHGSIKTYVYSDDGRTQITGFHGAGELIGLDAIGATRFVSEAIVLETTNLCEMSYVHFQGLSRKLPGLQDQMISIMSQVILRNQQMMLLLGKKNATERVATYLVSLSRHFYKNKAPNSLYRFTMSRRDIGNYLGLTQETISRILARLQDEGVIRFDRKYVQIINMDRLNGISHIYSVASE